MYIGYWLTKIYSMVKWEKNYAFHFQAPLSNIQSLKEK